MDAVKFNYAKAALWAVPYSARDTLEKVIGKIDFPADAYAYKARHRIYQHGVTCAIIAATSIAVGPIAFVVAGVVAAVKIAHIVKSGDKTPPWEAAPRDIGE